MSHVTDAMLAQAGGGSAVFWCLVLIGLLVAGFAGVALLKRWLKSEVGGGTGFTLGELRALRDQGKMTPEEFEKAKVLILGSAMAGAKSPIPEDRKRRPGALGGEVGEGGGEVK